jgi:serine/threonine protein kinase
MGKAKKPLLFVCYSHTDQTWKERLEKFLAGGSLPDTLQIFSDAAIRPGVKWEPEITDALRRATAALVLVSQDFMISPFIQQVEMRELLLAQAHRGLRLFLVPVRATYYDGTYLENFQWARPPNKPLSLLPESEREGAMVEVCQLIARELAMPADTPTIERTVACLESVPRLDLPANYELQAEVGRGDYARCFLAKDLMIDRDVIIKVLHEELSRESEAYDRYVRSSARLHHRNILGVLFSQTNKLPHFIVTPSVSETLKERMERSWPTLEQATQWIIRLADTLHFAHTRGCVHARLRPHEIRLDENNEPILAGFRTVEYAEAHPTVALGGKVTLEDCWYASPETRSGGVITAKSDQYLLGLLAYELFSGGQRVVPSSWGSLLDPAFSNAILHPRPLYEVAEHCGEGLSDVIMRALDVDPSSRWNDLNEFARRLEAASSGQFCFEAAKASYRRCAQRPEFYETVYDELFAVMPSAKVMFKHVSLERQFDVLRDAIWLLLKYPDMRDADEPTILSRVARTHSHITAAQYDLFRDAILAAVKKHDAPELVTHWREAMTPGFAYLKGQMSKPDATRKATVVPHATGKDSATLLELQAVSR